ncbi:MAG TPA: lipopolysaccharide assembly protein LapA domain-containing protein [Candidatus Binatia bacterium]|jgi:uncharacterized integral membrane protein|nr:lipopolysaccharide assembly protein LapA domain-containing protein [Candidatus Binatia bacterium]
MLVLLIAVIFGLAVSYFATQNTTPVTIRVAEYALEDVPLYLVAIGSLLVGLFIAWILYFAKSVSSTVTIYGKNHAVKRAQQTAAGLEQRVHELETENERLKTKPLSF